jgi:hypothetical protein
MDRITLTLDSKTLDYVANVLGQRPYAEVAPVLQNIAQQVQLQQQAKGPLTGPQEKAPEALNGGAATEASPTH